MMNSAKIMWFPATYSWFMGHKSGNFICVIVISGRFQVVDGVNSCPSRLYTYLLAACGGYAGTTCDIFDPTTRSSRKRDAFTGRLTDVAASLDRPRST